MIQNIVSVIKYGHAKNLKWKKSQEKDRET